MRGVGAARRRQEQEPEPPDPVAAAVAALTRLSAGTGDLITRMGQRDSEIAAAISAMQARCPAGGDLAAQGEKITSRQSLQLVETIALEAHWAEAREVLEELGPRLAALYEMGIAEGRRLEAADRDAQAPPARGPRHARKHLRPVPGIPATAARAAAAGIVAAGLTGGIVAMHEESAVRVVASSPAAARGVQRMPPDTAVLIPSSPAAPGAYVPKHAKPSADAATATPAPSPSLPVLASPSPSPAVSSPAPSPGVLDVQTFRLSVDASGQGRIVFTAVGGPVQWSASVYGPVTLRTYGGTLQAGQSASVAVTVQGGGTGSAVVTITDGNGSATQVPVTWVALPVL